MANNQSFQMYETPGCWLSRLEHYLHSFHVDFVPHLLWALRIRALVCDGFGPLQLDYCSVVKCNKYICRCKIGELFVVISCKIDKIIMFAKWVTGWFIYQHCCSPNNVEKLEISTGIQGYVEATVRGTSSPLQFRTEFEHRSDQPNPVVENWSHPSRYYCPTMYIGE